MLTSQLVRNYLTEDEIYQATVIAIDKQVEAVLIRIGESNFYENEWVMLSYDTGAHRINALGLRPSERVREHWNGFIDNVKIKHAEYVKRLKDDMKTVRKN